MTPQEQQQLDDFLIRLTHVGYVNKDPMAAQAIAAAFSRQPDAPYLTVQRCLQLEQALAAANARIAQLEKQQPAAGSFIDTNGWGRPAPTPAPAPAAAAASDGFMNSRAGSWLGSAAATAAGVAGGALLAQGISHMFNPGHGGWLSSGAGAPVEYTTVNNYFVDDDAPPQDDYSTTSWM